MIAFIPEFALHSATASPLIAAGLANRPYRETKAVTAGEDGQQTVEYDSSRDCEKTILSDLLIGAPEDVLPAFPGYLPRRLRVPAAARFACPSVLQGVRLVTAARATEGPVRRSLTARRCPL